MSPEYRKQTAHEQSIIYKHHFPQGVICSDVMASCLIILPKLNRYSEVFVDSKTIISYQGIKNSFPLQRK